MPLRRRGRVPYDPVAALPPGQRRPARPRRNDTAPARVPSTRAAAAGVAPVAVSHGGREEVTYMTRTTRLVLGAAVAVALAAPAFPAQAGTTSCQVTPKECIQQMVTEIEDTLCVTPLCSKSQG